MGYTHYWQYKPESIEPAQAMILCQDARHIIEFCGVAITGWRESGEFAPEFNPENRLAFNGLGEDNGHETFAFYFHPPQEPESDEESYNKYRYEKFIENDRQLWEFCKTARKPYDAVVTAVLLRARDIIPTIEIDSDGDWSDWTAGRELYETAFGLVAVCPWMAA